MLTRLTQSDFNELYAIIKESFPKNETRPKNAQRALFEKDEFRAYGVKSESGDLRAFITFWKLNGFTYGEHFAVAEKERGAGLGSEIIKEAVRLAGNRFCLEVEPPETEIAKRRIRFYGRCGFTLNGYDYLQPPLGKDRAAVPLMIMSTNGALTPAEFEAVKAEIYKNVYGVEAK